MADGDLIAKNDNDIPLLDVKTSIPPVRSGLVERKSLLKELNNSARYKMVLVAAPAGSGKTTLITSWLAQSNQQVAWVSLEKNDNATVRFLAYLVGALRKIFPNYLLKTNRLIHSAEPPPVQSILNYLINELGENTDQTVIVLDDYHVIGSTEVDEIITFLVKNSPPNIRLVIISREQPRFPLATLRLHGKLLEVTFQDLRFTAEEIDLYFQDLEKHSLTEQDLLEIEKRTEGWIAGIQLTALGLKDRYDKNALIQGLSGQDRYISEFLIDEVLSQQPQEIIDFLLKTSILRRLSTSLCNTVLDVQSAYEILQYLDRSNLFLIPLDHNREWYRYHHLFAGLLQSRLKERYPNVIASLITASIRWHETNGFLEEAADIAIEAGQYEYAAKIIDSIAPTLMNDYSKIQTVIRWLDIFPVALLREHQALWEYYILALIGIGKLNHAIDVLNKLWGVEGCFDDLIDEEITTVKAKRSALLCPIIFQSTMDGHHVKQLAEEALTALSEQQGHSRILALQYSGFVNMQLGDIKVAHEPIQEALNLIPIMQTQDYNIFTNYLAGIVAAQGHLSNARNIYERSISFAHNNGLEEGAHFSDALVGLGRLQYEWNSVKEGVELITRGVELVAAGTAIERFLDAYLALWSVRNYLPETDTLSIYLEQIRNLAERYRNPPVVIQRIDAIQTRMLLADHELNKAVQWRNKFENNITQITSFHQYEWLLVARIYEVCEQPQKAIDILQRLVSLAEQGGRLRDRVMLGTRLALNFNQAAEQQRATDTLITTLNHAYPEGYLRTFIDGGQDMRTLLTVCLESTDISATLNDYIREIIDAFDPVASDTALIDGPDQLSPREIEVLRLLSRGMSYLEVAENLLVTENTVRTHVKRMYSKLHVRNRMQAVNKARTLGLLDAPS